MKKRLTLSAFPLATTNTVDEAELRLSHTLTDLQILKAEDSRQYQLTMNGVNFRRSALVFNHFGNHTQIRSRSPGDSLLFIIGSGTPATFIMDGEEVTVSPQKAAIVSPRNLVNVIRPKGSEVLVARVSEAVLNNYFQQITEQYYKTPLQFNTGIDLANGPGTQLKSILSLVVSELETIGLSGLNPNQTEIFDHMLMTALVELRANLPDKSPTGSYDMPDAVRNAEEYIEAHLTDPITITDLLKICGCSRSALFSAFQSFRGYSPMEFLIERRLQRARKQLLANGGYNPVSSIALSSGFTHLGRFSDTYKKRFGESPSETKSRSI